MPDPSRRTTEDVTAVTLYCDEIVRASLVDDMLIRDPEYWSYIGILIVPKDKKADLLKKLLDARCLDPENDVWGSCPQECKWHEDNNTEIHYSETDDHRKYKVACSWIDLMIENAMQDWGLIYFYILGLNLTKLDLENFGPASQQDRAVTIYNRFFRTAVQKSTKSFFAPSDHIVIENIYHDSGPGEHHEYFPWHAVWRLGRDDSKLSFGCNEITFISSDHREPDGHPIHSHFVQFIDLILGCTFNLLHYSSKDANKVDLALRAKELLGDRLIGDPNNKNSSYNYFSRQRIEFFPRENLSGYDADSIVYQMKRMDNFYTLRELRIERRQQPTFFTVIGK